MTRRLHGNAGRAESNGLLGSIFFCAATGVGIGVFFLQPAIGGLIGGAVGILLGLTLIPALLRD